MSAPPSIAADAGRQQTHPPPIPTPQLNRSCESCRSLKVRCLPDPTSLNHCQRCVKANRSCVFVAPQRRRPRKRTDSRVAQLEKEMRLMRSLLKERFRPDESSAESAGSDREESHEPELEAEPHEGLDAIPEAPSSTASGSTRNLNQSPVFPPPGVPGGFTSTGSLPGPSFAPTPPEVSRAGDVVDQGLIGNEYADELVEFFIHELTPFFPAVVLHPKTTALSLRRTKPVLFLSVIAAAAIAMDSAVATMLNREMVRVYAEKFFIEGHKSLELVQALIIMIVFYYPPDSPLKLQFYQYTHVAATMALEIGLASKRRVSKKPNGENGDHDTYDEHMAEQARAILGCYHLTSTVAMKTRRPNLLLFNDWMVECVKHLEKSPIPVDRHTGTWFELQRITDEAMASFGLDDTSSTTPLTESRVQAVLRWFDNRMQSWKKKIPADMLTVPMTLDYHHTNLAVYELAVGEGYRDPDAIKQQHYTLPSLDEDGNSQHSSTSMSAVRVDITMKWLNAAHEMLDFFLSCDTDTMRKIPNLVYTRVGVAFMSLLKIYFSVRTGAMGNFITPKAVKVEMYMDALTMRLREAGSGLVYKIPSRWYYVVAVKGRDWYDRFQRRQTEKETGMASASSMNSSPPIPQGLTPMPTQSPFQSVDQSQIGPYSSMGLGVSQMSSFSPMGHQPTTYSTPEGMSTQWSTSTTDQNSHILATMSQFGGYTPVPTVPTSSFVYEQSPPTYPSGNQQPNNFFPPATGMELDGWLPDGSLFGAPSLPEF